MPYLDVALVEWPGGPEHGGPRLLGRTSDPRLVAAVRKRIATERKRELARLEPPVRLVRDSDDETPTRAGSTPNP